MKTLLIAVLTLLTTLTFAQQSVTWKGGTPGNETSWNEARNWSNNKVPTEFTDVIIKQTNSGHNAQPVIKHEVRVASVELHGGAVLTIEKDAQLVVDGENNYTEGISMYGGQLINKGTVYLYSLDVDISEDYLDQIQNTGLVWVNSKLRDWDKQLNDKESHLVGGN